MFPIAKTFDVTTEENPMHRLVRTTALAAAAVALLTAATPSAEATPTNRFQTTLAHYETVRLALVADRWDTAASEAAKRLQAEVKALAASPTAEAAAVPAGKLADVRGLLPEVQKAAAELAAAKDLKTARDAFYGVSKPLVRWQAATGKPGPVVAYCSMAKRSWLQPTPQPIGNPYYGKQMERCGEVMR